MAQFQAQAAGQAFWLGKKKIKFHKGIYQTDDQAVIAFLKKQKECVIVPGTDAPPPQEVVPAPASAPVQPEPSPEPVASVADPLPRPQQNPPAKAKKGD
jgi:hypothetical protein